MSVICPTVTAFSVEEYCSQIYNIAGFAERVHIDLMDGKFTPTRSPNLIQAWWPKDLLVDIHLMYQQPLEHVETLVSLKPHMVIVHAEAEGDLIAFATHLHKFDIKVGVALLKDTEPVDVAGLIEVVDHVLIFSGDLGRFGGKVDTGLFKKISTVKHMNPEIEIGWDGGANVDNVAELSSSGVDVINVGGSIQRADDAEAAYATLVAKL